MWIDVWKIPKRRTYTHTHQKPQQQEEEERGRGEKWTKKREKYFFCRLELKKFMKMSLNLVGALFLIIEVYFEPMSLFIARNALAASSWLLKSIFFTSSSVLCDVNFFLTHEISHLWLNNCYLHGDFYMKLISFCVPVSFQTIFTRNLHF